VPGANLHDSRLVVQPAHADQQTLLEEKAANDPEFLRGHFWSDGMVRVSGREYNMVEESPCFQGNDYSCLSCHALHQPVDDERSRKEWANDQLRPGMDGDQACMQCHASEIGDVAAHTHHDASSSGSRCYNCHMPYTAYGQLKTIRSHQISNPSATESVEVGRPNACNLCHLDQSLGWTADHLEAWYGTPPPALTPEEETTAASVLWSLTGDAGLRAILACAMGHEDAQRASGVDWTPAYLIPLLDDPYAAVRYVAFRSLKRYPGFGDFEYDYLSPHGQRERDVQRALSIWLRVTPPDTRTPREATLVGPDGEIRSEEFRRLAAQRDDRYVSLQE
jgi:hypothetical protein